MSKGGSKVLTAVIAFILGFVFAIVFEVAAVFYVLSANLDTVFGMVGFENADEGGNQYINTDESTGGVSNVLALVSKLSSMADEMDTYSLGKLEELFPALDGLTSGIFDALNDYVEIDVNEVKEQKFVDLPQYLTDKVMEIQPASIMSSLDVNLDGIALVILEGMEANYVYDGENMYPVYYDEYVKVDGVYYTGVNSAYPYDLNDATTPSPEDWLVNKGSQDEDGKQIYRQYYYNCDGVYYVTKQDNDGNYILNKTKIYLQSYGDDGVKEGRLTGNYYYENDGTKVVVKPITLSSLSEDALAPLDEYPLTDLFEGQELIAEVFGDISLGDLINNRVDFENLINDVELSSIIGISPTNTIMAYLGYGLSNVTEAANNMPYAYTATYKLESGEVVNCYIETTTKNDEVVIGRAYYYTGTGNDITQVEIGCCKVSEISDVIKDVTVPALLSVKGDDAIMAYLGYGVYNIETMESFSPADFGLNLSDEGLARFKETYKDYSYIGRVANGDNLSDYYTVLIKTNSEGIISAVVRADNNQQYVAGTGIDDLNAKVSNIADALRIRDVLNINYESSKFMLKICDLTIANVDQAVNILTIDDFISPKTTDTLLMYVSYNISQITDITPSENNGGLNYYSAVYWNDGEPEVVYITADTNHTIVGFYSDKACTVEKDIQGTHIQSENGNGITDVVGKLTERMTLNEIVTINPDNTFLYAIRNSTINDIPTAIANLGLQEVFAKDIYGVSDVTTDIKTVVAANPQDGQIAFDEAFIYYTSEDGAYTLVNKDDENNRGKLTLAEYTAGVNAGKTYYSYGKPTGAWWFMLSKDKSEAIYTVNQIGTLMSNVTNNVLHATLSEMREAGLISEEINASVPVSRSDDGKIFYTRDANDCTVDQLIKAISLMTTDDNGYAKALMGVDGYSIQPEVATQG